MLRLAFALCLLASTAYAQDSAPTRIETAPAGTSTDVPLRDLLTQRIDAEKELTAQGFELRDKAIAAALEAAKLATDKAERAQELRNTVANEFRDSLSDLGNTMARQDVLTSVERNLIDRMEAQATRIAALENRESSRTGQGSGIQTAWTVLLGIAVVAGVVIAATVAFRRKPIT